MKTNLLIYLFVLITYSLQAQVPTNGLVAEYTFNNGTGDDTNPNNYGPNNASLVSSTTSDRFGNANYAQRLNGSLSQYINLGNSSDLKPSSGTVSIWVKMHAVSYNGNGFAYNPIFLSKNTNAPGSYFEGCAISTRMSNNTVLFLTTQSGATNEKYFFTSTPGILTSPTSWKHLVITYDNNRVKGYIDGVLVGSKTKGFTSTFHSTKDILIGNSQNSTNNRAFNGAVDDVRIYNRVLSASEVAALFNEVNPYVPPVTITYAELKQELDGGYVQLQNDILRIKFKQDYAVSGGGETISYKIYKWNRTSHSGTFNASYGINWKALDLSSFNLNNNEHYTLEFEANKGEKYILRFKTKSI